MSNELYQKDFKLFQQLTDEKPKLLKWLQLFLATEGVRSVLDIGAGNGDLAIPLSQCCQRYQAVEKHPEYAKILRLAHIPVVEVAFPVRIGETYDLVLLSHVLARAQEKWQPVLDAAWETVEPSGTLLIVTYRGGEDDWTKLVRGIGRDESDYNRTTYQLLLSYLQNLGNVRVDRLESVVSSASLDEMVGALSFVASGGVDERKAEFLEQRQIVEQLLNRRYRHEDSTYRFPFQHYLVQVKRA